MYSKLPTFFLLTQLLGDSKNILVEEFIWARIWQLYEP
jgi:hypothetical protein